MPKIKTSKSTIKRISKKTASGKILRRKATAQHLVRRKSHRTVENSGINVEVTKSQKAKLKKLAPYL